MRAIVGILIWTALLTATPAFAEYSTSPISSYGPGGCIPHSVRVDRALGLEVVVDNKPLQKIVHNGQTYVIAPKNKDYQLFLRCNTPGKVMAFASVDGLSIMTGKTPQSSDWGYVIKKPGSFIPGYRLDGKTVARFHFGDKHASYAAKTNSDTSKIGEITVKFMTEQTPSFGSRVCDYTSAGRGGLPTDSFRDKCSFYSQRGLRFNYAPNIWKTEPPRSPFDRSPQPLPAANDLGTEFGRRASFEPGTTAFQPTGGEVSISVRYASREALQKAGILPDPKMGPSCKPPQGWTGAK